MEEAILIEKALENLAKQTGVTAIWRPQNGDVDGEIELTYNDKPYRIPVEVKKEVRAHQLGKLFDLKNKDTYKFTRKDQLLQKWIRAYNEKLKPALEIGTFRFVNKDKYFNWKDIDLKPGETFWGGEPAGGILTDYLQPEQYTLYTAETRGDIIKKYQLAPDKNGDIKVYLKFWRFTEELLKTVPPLLVYADLINSNDRRCIQTAERVYDVYLQTKFRAY